MQIQRICSAPLRFEDGRAHSAPKLAADPLHATALLLLCIENPWGIFKKVMKRPKGWKCVRGWNTFVVKGDGCSTAAKIELDYSGQSEILSHETREALLWQPQDASAPRRLSAIFTLFISRRSSGCRKRLFSFTPLAPWVRVGFYAARFISALYHYEQRQWIYFPKKNTPFLPAHSSMFKCSSLREKEKCCLRFLELFC